MRHSSQTDAVALLFEETVDISIFGGIRINRDGNTVWDLWPSLMERARHLSAPR